LQQLDLAEAACWAGTTSPEPDQLDVIADHSVFIGDARQPAKRAAKSVAKPSSTNSAQQKSELFEI